MTMLPLLLSAWWAEMGRPHALMDQNFGLGLYPEQLVSTNPWAGLYPNTMRNKAMELYYKPLIEFLQRGDTGAAATITTDKDIFKVILDVQQFTPEEISLKLVDRYIVVEAKHEEKRDEHGFVSRQFVRRYLLPEQVDADKLESKISTDGILTITAPLIQKEESVNERTIKIELTGKPAIRVDTKKTTDTENTEKPIKEGEQPIQQSDDREEITVSEGQEEKDKPEK